MGNRYDHAQKGFYVYLETDVSLTRLSFYFGDPKDDQRSDHTGLNMSFFFASSIYISSLVILRCGHCDKGVDCRNFPAAYYPQMCKAPLVVSRLPELYLLFLGTSSIALIFVGAPVSFAFSVM